MQRARRVGRVQFVVVSNNISWVKTSIDFTSIGAELNQTSPDEVDVVVAHSEHHDAGFDFAVLTLCDGVIMSTGDVGQMYMH